MKNEYLPTMLSFVVLVLGVSYLELPMWFKVLVVASGVVMMILSAVVLVGAKSQEKS